MNSNNPQAPMSEREGEEFLADLDAALAGRAAIGRHAELANFGAKLAAALPPEATAEETEPLAAGPQAAPIVQLDRRLSRYKLGVLDVAALVALSVVLTLVARSYFTPVSSANPPAQTVAGDDDEHEPELTPVPPEEKKIRETLRKKLTVDFQETPFSEVLDYLNQQTGINFIIDPRLVVANVHKKPISLRAIELEGGSLLNVLARMAGVGVVFRDNAALITSRDAIASKLTVYNVRDLKFATELKDSIENHLFANEFADKASTSVAINDGALIVMNNAEVHQAIASLLRSIRTAQKTARAQVSVTAAHDAWRRELHARLQKKISFEFWETPANDAFGWIATHVGVPIVVDPRIKSTTFSLKVNDCAADAALGWICEMIGCRYRLADEVLYIENQDAPLLPELRIYNVADLRAQPGAKTTGLAELIRTRIRPDLWDSALGTAIAEVHGLLIVRQQSPLFATIEELLASLRALDKAPETKSR